MKNGNVIVSVWENNREDSEDSASQVRSESEETCLIQTNVVILYYNSRSNCKFAQKKKKEKKPFSV